MARIGLAVVIWVVFVGGLGLYMQERKTAAPAVEPASSPLSAPGRCTIEVTTSFEAAPDPFALQTADSGPPSALILRMDGRDLLRLTERVEPGKPIRIEDVEGFEPGANELWVMASPRLEESDRRQFVQVRVLRDQAPIASETFWSEGGGLVTGSLRFDMPAGNEGTHDK